MPARQAQSSATSMIWLISLCRFCEAVAVGMLLPVLPGFIQDLGTGALERWFHPHVFTPEELTAAVFSATGFAMAAVQLLAGRLSDTLDRRKPFIVGGMAGGMVCTLLFLQAGDFTELFALRVLQGICFGFTFPPLMAMVAHHAPPEAGGRVLGLYSTLRLMGFGVGPAVGGWIASEWGRDAMFVACAALLLVSIAMVSWWVPEYRERAPRDPSQPRPPLPPVDPRHYLFGAAVLLMMVGISIMMAFFPTYQRRFGATDADLGLVYAAFVLSRGLCQFPAGAIGDRFDKKRVLMVSLVGFAPLVGLMGFAGSLGHLIALRVGLGVAAAGITSAVAGMAAERSAPGARARTMGINTMAFSLGTAIGPLGGFLARWSPEAPFVIAGSAGFLMAGAVALWVPSDRQHRARIAARPHAPLLEAETHPG